MAFAIISLIVAFFFGMSFGFILAMFRKKEKLKQLPKNLPSSLFRTKAEIDEEINCKEYLIIGQNKNICPICNTDDNTWGTKDHITSLCHPHNRLMIYETSWWKPKKCKISTVHRHCQCSKCNARWIVNIKEVPWKEIQ